MSDAIDPRVLAYEVNGLRVRENKAPGGVPFYTVWRRSDNTYLNVHGEVTDEWISFPTFDAALTALLRYADRVLPEGALRVVPSLSWPGDWIVRNNEASKMLHSDGVIRDAKDISGGWRWPTPAAALLALIEHEEAEHEHNSARPFPPEASEQPDPQPRWEVMQKDARWFVTDTNGNYLCCDRSVTTIPNEWYEEWLARAAARYANAEGPHPPRPEVWTLKEDPPHSWDVLCRGEIAVSFWDDGLGGKAEEHAAAWMEAKRAGGRGDE
jgi:hypothetical protein